ncbi:MAG: peptide chain release factor N(5)-glutamine methyltransferase [Bacteroidales bacterium]|nr:peptide chain release factor N(5)-glutamine methyltransferase [Bacteroidales bacterium]
MNSGLITVKSLTTRLRTELADYYHPRELNAIINIVISHISSKDRVFLLANPNHRISEINSTKVRKICDDLKNRVPVQYIIGETEFYGKKYKVSKETLIPRPETEELVDLVINDCRDKHPSVLDIGTGSGCIAISLYLNIKEARVSASDISPAAIEVAAANAEMNEADINFIEDNILDPVINKYGQYDVVVSNPPYITVSEKKYMNKNILEYEPHIALFVPDDNAMKYYIAILELCRKVLNPGGGLYLEINENRAGEIADLMKNYNYSDISIVRDINNKKRIAGGRKK